MGVVVEATHLQLQTRVALKFLDEAMASEPTAVARFTREARASAQLKSEHICRVSDFGVDHDVPYIVMELLVGTDLARLSKLRTLDVPTAASFISQACIGLAEAHAAQIIHRDLKPGNIFLTRRTDGSPLIKVLDFGVAKTAPSGDEAALTGTSSVVGSPGFMSPEQFRSSRTVDARTDVWSLGIILFKLVTGKLPFNGDGFAEFALSITRDPTPPIANVPPAFAEIVARCLEKDVDRRCQDVTTLANELAIFAGLARSSKVLALSVDPPPPIAADAAAKATILGTSAQPEQRTLPGTMVPTQAPSYLAGELAPGTIVGEYRIERKIGEGGMGVVYGAIHPLIGKKAAIKVIAADLGTDPVVVQRFVQEARSVNQIGHPNIVDVFAFGKLPDGRNYFVMEHLQGESLRARLTRSFIPLPEGIQILDEIVSALEAAHEKNIVHRDLKPDNVFLANVRGSYILVKLLDFGIAKLAPVEGFAKTNTGEMMGTPAYLSPEQARGRNVDHRTDIYALGCMMYEVVTGRIPFIAESPMDVVLMHITAPPRNPSELVPNLPPALAQIIVQTLDKEPDNRPSLAEVRNVFAELVASGMVHLEAGSGATFRSELARGRQGNAESRTPASNPPEPRRPVSSTDAPTKIAFNPALEAVPPAIPAIAPKPRSRFGLALVIILVGLLVPTSFIVYGIVNKGGTTDAPHDASVVVVARDAASAPDAATAVVGATPTDAASVVTPPVARTVHIRVNVPVSRILIDGAEVIAPNGVATVALADGAHNIEVSAPGRIPFKTELQVSSMTTAIEVKLERSKRQVPAGSKQGSGSGQTNGDYTIDPF